MTHEVSQDNDVPGSRSDVLASGWEYGLLSQTEVTVNLVQPQFLSSRIPYMVAIEIGER